MDRESLPEDVVQFIMDYIDSVPQLEALLLMWETAPRAWTGNQLAERVYVPVDTAHRILQHLLRSRLIVAESEAGPFRFNSEHADAEGVARLAAIYGKVLVRVAQLIHSKGSQAVREFARAFRLKRED